MNLWKLSGQSHAGTQNTTRGVTRIHAAGDLCGGRRLRDIDELIGDRSYIIWSAWLACPSTEGAYAVHLALVHYPHGTTPGEFISGRSSSSQARRIGWIISYDMGQAVCPTRLDTTTKTECCFFFSGNWPALLVVSLDRSTGHLVLIL